MRDVRVGEDLFKIVLGGSCEDPSKVGCGGNQRYLHFDHAILWVRSSVVVSYLGHPDILQHYHGSHGKLPKTSASVAPVFGLFPSASCNYRKL